MYQSELTSDQLSPGGPASGKLVAGVSISAREQWYYGELLKILESVAELLALIEEQYAK